MLVLTRKEGDSVVITTPHDGEIRLTVKRASRGQAKLVFYAPPEIRIDRLEVHETRQEHRTDGQSQSQLGV